MYLISVLGLYIAKILASFYIMVLNWHLMDSLTLPQEQLNKFIQDPGYRKVAGLSKVRKVEHPYNKNQQDKYVQLA